MISNEKFQIAAMVANIAFVNVVVVIIEIPFPFLCLKSQKVRSWAKPFNFYQTVSYEIS